MKHGTVRGYNNHRCRCDDCRSAYRNYYRTFVRFRLNPDADQRVGDLPQLAGEPTGPWAARAACRGKWVHEIPRSYVRKVESWPLLPLAVDVCHRCPVLEQCRRWVLLHRVDPTPVHITAAMTPKQRRAARRDSSLPVSGRRPQGETA